MDESRTGPIDEAAVAEAAIWVARLQSDHRPAALEGDFRAWIAADPRHQQAFEAASDVWDLSGGARVRRPTPVEAVRRRRAPIWLGAAAMAASLVGFGLWTWQQPRPIETAIGEQRSMRLADGSTVMLNTATEVRTRYSDSQRLVFLDRGEASFEVAHDVQRPFIVDANGTRIIAVGTVFDVRLTEGRLAVTLAEGKVRVVEPAGASGPKEIELTPGQRLVQTGRTAPPKLDAVNLEAARAWRSGQVVFADTALAEAAQEMNRYSDIPLKVSGGQASALRISGSFKAGDNAKFARALADLYGLKVSGGSDHIQVGDPS